MSDKVYFPISAIRTEPKPNLEEINLNIIELCDFNYRQGKALASGDVHEFKLLAETIAEQHQELIEAIKAYGGE